MNFRRLRRFAARVMLSCLLPLTPLAAVASTVLQGRVVAVHDGDTLTVLDRYRREYRIRLHLIDAPEKNQDYGSRSKQSLSQLVYKRDVSIEVTTVDRYHRLVGKVLWGGYDINLEQVARGMAWVYRRYGKDERYLAAEAAARRARLGLWAKARPVPPWEFRKDERDDGPWYDPRQWFRR